MSKDHEYLYPYSAQEAKKRNQLPMWRESYHANVACRNAIEETIRQNFDGMHLKKDCLEPVLAEYGYKRTEWVLATTLQELSWDGRFSRANKQWAARRYIPQDERHNAEITVRSHPAILDGFVDLYREAYQKLGLFGPEHCVGDRAEQDYICCASPVGYNAFGQQFERVLPASSVANLYPFNYSGKTDAKDFYVGRDKYGSNILVDFDQRDEDKTSANILILGNSGQGKSYLMKLLILNLLESGKSVITLDAEHEQQEMCEAVGGCFADLMAGKYIINVLEPKCWDDGGDPDDTAAPEAFRKSTLLAQHVSFLKDFFRAYKDFSDAHIDTIEIMVSKLYAKCSLRAAR